MDKVLEIIERKLLPPLTKLAELRHLQAVRDGIISTMPMIMIGSFFVLLVQFPIPAWKSLIAPISTELMFPYRITVGMMAIYASYGMGSILAKSYGLDRTSGGVISLGAFLMTVLPQIATSEATGASLGFVIPMTYLGGSGMFTAILCMIFSVEVLRFCKTHNITIRMPEQVPPAVSRSFEAIIPGMIVITVVWFVSAILKINVNEVLMGLFSPLVAIAGNTYLGVIIPVLLITILWSAGIHGVSVIGSVIRPIWLVLLEQNITAVANGQVAPNIGTEGFFDLFVWIGGSGGTLALCILFLFAKSSYLKEIGKLSIVPGIFNINEPIIFGAPIVVNPLLAIPFILGPAITTTITYIAMKFDLVAKVSVVAPFAIPAPIKAFISTGGDWRGIVLVLINFTISLLIYWPFVKAYDKKMLAEEQLTNSETFDIVNGIE